MEIKISVVIPTYKRPQLLLKCLTALITQVFYKGYFEIVVVSDGPDEETKEIVMLLAGEGTPFIHYHALHEKKGPAAARNAGWRMAKGELIAFTDDDCIPDPGWLNSLWECYLKEGQQEIAFSGKTVVPVSTPPTDYELNISLLEQCEFITANCACTKKALRTVDGFDERFTRAWREDSDLQFKFIEQGIPLYRAEEAVVTHPVRKAKWGVSLAEQSKTVFNALLYKKYPRLYKQKVQAHAPWHYYLIVFSFLAFMISLSSAVTFVSASSFSIWAIGTVWFTRKRLKNTSHTFCHISEMAATSLLIPFLSIYWRIYGAFKFKVLFF